MRYNCGYDSSFTNTITGIQAGLAGINGIANYFSARTAGATPGQAVGYGLATTSMGVGNALIGNSVDQMTHSYWGSTMSNFMAPVFNNPFMATSLMGPMFLPTGGFYGLNSMWTQSMLFGSPMMYGMPSFGGFCCRC